MLSEMEQLALDWIQLAAILALTLMGIGRGLTLYARGVRVFVIDPQRTLAVALIDLLTVLCFLVWGYEVVAHAWPLPFRLVPAQLDVVLFDFAALQVVGTMLLLLGLAVYGLALYAFGTSWRLGIDREKPGALVTHGVFARSRNPIYVGLDLLAIGAFLIRGRLLFLLLAVVLVGLLHRQIRREERFLEDHYGDAYRQYCARARRYAG